jgi:ribosomal protein L11 methyltransferase
VVAKSLDRFILAYLEEATTKVSAADLIRICAQTFQIHRSSVKRALRRLAADQRIQYTNLFGGTQVDLAWSRPRQVSPRILLCPEESVPKACGAPGAVVLRIAGGAAFGAGDHPTTRLALQALDAMFAEKRISQGATVLDIGTGSGVLAIGAVLLGADTALALDIDPCALWEARGNVAFNDLTTRIRVGDDAVEDLAQTFDLVLANLRLPTLLRLASTMSRLINRDASVVVSGIRPEETADLVKCWSDIGLQPCWMDSCQGWAGIGFYRSSRMG